jgi:uncharacterized protein YdbL (DUF1318 family)
MKKTTLIIFAATMITVGGMFSLNAATAEEIKARMRQREPAIEQLKDAGVVGENNLGFLEVRDNSADTKNAVDTENKDRKAVYEVIARKIGTSAEQVGKRRAAKIVELGKSQQWFQDASGKWYQKK